MALAPSDYHDLARIHALSFSHPRPWSAEEIAQMMAVEGTFLCARVEGFVIGRVILDEVELLTIAVDPDYRQRGIGAGLMTAFLTEATARGARHAFLEVAADNLAAQRLYAASAWQNAGRRRGYYRAKDGQPIDALVMTRALGETEGAPPSA